LSQGAQIIVAVSNHHLLKGRLGRGHGATAVLNEIGNVRFTPHDSSNLIDRPALKRLAAEESMSDDPDLPKANYALQVLRQARLSRNETAARMVGDLVYEMASTGLRTPEIEEAREAAWVAISALASALKEEAFAAPALWKAALIATESWIELLI
jgi:hypothetical protein